MARSPVSDQKQHLEFVQCIYEPEGREFPRARHSKPVFHLRS